MIFIGLAGYLLPIPSLIWAWVRWFKSKPRFVPPAWRSMLAFSGLILVSAIGLFVRLQSRLVGLDFSQRHLH